VVLSRSRPRRFILWLLLVVGVISPPVAHASRTRQGVPAWRFAWAMSGHDPQRTFRSPAVGPTHPRLLFQVRNVTVQAVGPDGMMYGSVNGTHGRRVAALYPDGGLRVLYPRGDGFDGELALRRDGVLLTVPSDIGDVSAFSPGAKVLWRVRRVGLSKGVPPLVTAGGYLYAAFVGHPQDGSAGLDIFAGNGHRQRIEAGTSIDAVARASDGQSYAVVEKGGGYHLQALDRMGKLKWEHQVSELVGSPRECTCLLVGPRDTIYSTDHTDLVATDRTGRRLSQRAMPDGILALAQRADGSLLVAGHRSVVAINSSGYPLWSTPLSPGLPAATERPSLVTDRSGTIYIGTADGMVHILAANGHEVSSALGGGYHYGYTPSILLGPTGRLIVGGTDGFLRVYAQ